ncbi:MAG: FAD-dependent oxidoreductase, partial [Candidatus Latescibacteria bacterium]|nr:FAD-dependent oxidoreductase [Candidatus Latescibacterota bacterium]
MNTYYDICVVGGGSGGFGAACAAARLGAKVILIEAGHGLGGTSTYAGVN